VSEEYVILRSSHEQPGYSIKTVLVPLSEWNDAPNPSDYFTPRYTANAEEVGRVQIMGDTDHLGCDTFESVM